MADAKSNLSNCLFDIAAGVENCHFVADELCLNEALDVYTKSVLWLLGAKLEQLSDELAELSECAQVKSIRLEDAVDDAPADDDDDGSPIGEIIRSGGVAMKNALALAPSNNQTAILEATANILNHAERLAPDEEHLSDWAGYRERVAAM